MVFPRRAHARVPCDLEVEVWSGPVGGARVGPARLVDLSLSGGYLRMDRELKRGGAYRLKWNGFEFPGRVVREGPKNPKHPGARNYGLVFTLTTAQETALRLLLDELRRGEKPGEDRFLRGYWG